MVNLWRGGGAWATLWVRASAPKIITPRGIATLRSDTEPRPAVRAGLSASHRPTSFIALSLQRSTARMYRSTTGLSGFHRPCLAMTLTGTPAA